MSQDKMNKTKELPFLRIILIFQLPQSLSTTMKAFKEGISPPLKEKALFYLTFDDLITQICQLRMCKDLPEIQSRIRKLLYYHFLNGKHERAMLTLAAYYEMIPNETDERKKTVSLDAWILEIFHLSVVMMNDIVSKNDINFGQLCWWRVAESKAQAFNDVLLLQAVVGAFNREFRNQKNYDKCVHPNIQNHEFSGRSPMEYRNFNKFSRSAFQHHVFANRYYEQLLQQDSFEGVTVENYKRIAPYQLQSLAVYLPLCSAIFLASNNSDFQLPKQYDDLVKDLVFFLKVKEEVRNHFQKGMKNASIFSWVLLKAKEICDERTYKKLIGLYKKTPLNVTSISDVYEKINLQLICEKWVEQEALDLKTRVEEIPAKSLPKNVILELLKS